MLPYSLNKQGIASLATLISTFVLIAGLVAGVILTQKQQEIREKAAPQPCYVCQTGLCRKVADPPYCNAGESECFVNEDCIIPTATPTKVPTPTPKPTNTPTPVSCIVDGKCIGPGESCCSGKEYFDTSCYVTETRCGIKPTPVTCSIKYENRGCGRSSCVQTAMWQLVTNEDCSTTSRCVPNHPQCVLTPTPTPTPYCSTNNLLRCDYGCEPDVYGGRCKPSPTPIPTPYCSDYLYDQCLYGCEPTSRGGKCKPPPTPTPTPYCSTGNLLRCDYGCEPDSYGGRCKSQPTPTPTPYCSDYLYDQCLYGCEPTSGGGKCKPTPTPTLYCSTENLLRCAYGCEPTSGGGKCKQKSYCSTENLIRCAYGCEPDSYGGRCKSPPVICEDLKTVEQCDSPETCAWYHCSNKCLSKETSYVSAGCAEPCPPLPGIPGGIQTCGFIGQTCESQSPYSPGQLYACQGGTWQKHGELRIIFDNSCSEEEKNKYRDLIGLVPLELHTNDPIKISCPDVAEKFCGRYSPRGLVEPLQTKNIVLSCNDPECQNAHLGCSGIVVHEFAHSHADSTNFWSSADIESFNKAIGCRSNGKGDFSFEEKPVTGYGKTNCAEAYAELIEVYTINPCNVANNPDWSRQYEWLLTNPDSPFQEKELCKDKGG